MKHTKQFRINPDDLVVKIRGALEDHDYGVIVDIKRGEVRWDPEIPWHRSEQKPIPQEQGGKECPGCRKGMWKLLRGGVGWAKELLRIGQVSPEIEAQRKDICLSCPSNCYDFGVCRDDWPDRPDDQQGCGCILALKVTQASESCPHEHWKRTDAGD